MKKTPKFDKLVPAVGLFDIETNNLDANYGQILCAVVKEYGENGEIFTYRCDEYKNYIKRPWDDRLICIELRDKLEEFDEISGYNSVFFDCSYLNTRLAFHGEQPLRSPKHRDLFFVVKRNLRLNRNSLDVVQRLYGLETTKTAVASDMWTQASRAPHLPEGKAAMDYIVDHCVRDVVITEQIWSKLSPFVKKVW